MKYYSIYDLVGVQVDDGYPWLGTLFVTQGAAEEGREKYEACRQKIHIQYQKKLRMDDVRSIGDGACIGSNVYIDEKYGARIEKTEDGFWLTAAQECNEWLTILMELSLLASEHTFIHAAALEKDGRVLMLPSWGGVGKTATVCHFIREHGWKLLGDDMIIIGRDGVRPYLKPFVIYPYHKNLFPELFTSGENHTVQNLTVSNMMSHAIPTVKRMLRPFPRVLAYLRKHNPQSMRVPPRKIFASDMLSEGGTLEHLVWLERSTGEQVHCHPLSAVELASKAASVSSVELFSARLESVYHMCGCGMLSFDEVVSRIYRIIEEMAENTRCDMLEIPASVDISDVGKLVYRAVAK